VGQVQWSPAASITAPGSIASGNPHIYHYIYTDNAKIQFWITWTINDIDTIPAFPPPGTPVGDAAWAQQRVYPAPVGDKPFRGSYQFVFFREENSHVWNVVLMGEWDPGMGGPGYTDDLSWRFSNLGSQYGMTHVDQQFRRGSEYGALVQTGSNWEPPGPPWARWFYWLVKFRAAP